MRNCNKKEGPGLFRKLGGMLGVEMRKKGEETATDAFFRTKYGGIMSPDHYVEAAQSYIRRMISARTDPYDRSPEEILFRSYYCMVDFDSEMKDYMDRIFEPFIEAGYSVTKISGKIEEIKNDLVYIISWDKRGGL